MNDTSEQPSPRGSTPSPRAVLVSGCSSDFGFRAAQALARRGHTVVAGLREPHGRGREDATRLTTLAAAEHLSLSCVDLDVDDEAHVERAVAEAIIRCEGRLDAVVSTAAYAVLGPLEACPPEQLLALLDTNVVGMLRVARAVLPRLRASGGGRIIQITSGLGRAVVPFMGAFAASAWAQECLAEALHYEAAPFGVEVAILEPAGYRHGGPPKKAVNDRSRLPPYESALVAFSDRLQRQHEGPTGDSEEVAEAVVAAVEAERVALRTLVGADALELVQLRQRLSADEYEREILERTGLAHLAAR